MNVKSVLFNTSIEEPAVLDTEITPILKAEGEYRELVRAVQDLRKAQGLTPSDTISITLASQNESLLAPFLEDFKKTVQAHTVTFSKTESEIIITL